MGFRFRRSIKLGGGVRLNVSKSGLGLSFGMRGLRYSVGLRGTRFTAGIPGTGMYWSTEAGVGTTTKSSRGELLPSKPPQLRVPWFAPSFAKNFIRGLNAFLRGDFAEACKLFEQASKEDKRSEYVSDDLFAGISHLNLGEPEKAIPHLEEVVQSSVKLPDRLMQKYVPKYILSIGGTFTFHKRVQLQLDVPLSSVGAVFLLAGAYQAIGESQKAIDLLEQLLELEPADLSLRLFLADLYYDQERYDDVISVSEGTKNADNVTLAILDYRTKALAKLGLLDAALELTKECLRFKKGRAPELLQEALYTRGLIYEQKGHKSRARKTFEKLFSMNSQYPGVREKLGLGLETSKDTQEHAL